ncbi:MAG: ADP-forming succinate--CoA ligase subunit beta [Nitrospirae bacterium]|nr:ADP-forming succinate--CoA ligase subunit beta [Nitrospirota bacterium]
MNIHEYQAKALFRQYNVPVPRGKMVHSVQEGESWTRELDSPVYVVKAQIHAGGRGKAGGVKLAKKRSEVSGLVKEMLGKVLVTHQTGPEGKEVQKVLIEEGIHIQRELYLSMLIDRATGWPTFIASTEGGMEVEEVAAHTPEKILKLGVDPSSGFKPFHGRVLAARLGLEKELVAPMVIFLSNLYRLFIEKGVALLEINPLVVTGQKTLVALDAKVAFDDNSLFRNIDVKEMRDLTEEDPLEVRASQYGLNYVKLDGEIGCMVNGAGLAMATMDVVKLAGSEPANFLDVGGGASKETVKHAFQILLDDPNVKGVFVNIFGGIVRCERIAGGIIEAAKEIEVKVPLVIRLEGTNAKEGMQMLSESGLNLQVAGGLWEGAQKVVKAIHGGHP